MTSLGFFYLSVTTCPGQEFLGTFKSQTIVAEKVHEKMLVSRQLLLLAKNCRNRKRFPVFLQMPSRSQDVHSSSNPLNIPHSILQLFFLKPLNLLCRSDAHCC